MPRTRQSTSVLKARIAELERERELLNSIANFAPSLICLVDAEGRVRPYATNKAFERTLGYHPHETGGVLFWERYVADGERAEARDTILSAIRSGASAESEGRWLQRDGGEIDVAWSCTSLPKIKSVPVWLITGTDITDRKRHEAEVRRSRARIVAAADDARRRIERNLHDGAQQRLIALLLRLRGAQRGAMPPEAAVEGAVTELAAAVKELRELAQGIHPSALSERGSPLTDRERDILAASLDGATIRDVAAKLYLSDGTVRNYVSTAIQKLGAANRMQAARRPAEKGWL